ncbi:FAD-dependent oxidoreductase [Patulibacter sp. NPDC049589]|uniref:GMC family oxidoreductase n=1 Tax=Patulibacter sp. NPDC049589 TaxID=3154731 RepID=UPI003436F79C
MSSDPNAPVPYDYVVVGAGSAGCVLAARLSEDPGVRVALVEAGGPDDAQELHVPVAFGSLFKSGYDWDFSSEAEPGLDGRHVYLPRGLVVGGSSSTNAMIYIRGNAADYDGWAADGADGWSADDVLPYFRRSEANERGADDHHGADGPLAVSDSRSNHPVTEAFVRAAEAAGHPRNPDFNGPRQDGFGALQVTQRAGLRCSAAAAFLHPVLHRENLELISRTRVLRILLEGDRAVGVAVERHGERLELRAEREVVLSAGAYGSPTLLMQSGIGPAEHLTGLGIPVRADLPVGDELQDHVCALLNFGSRIPTLETAFSPEALSQLEREGRGPLTSNVAEGAGFVRSRPGLPAPDLQFHVAAVGFSDEGLTPPTGPAFAFGPCVVKPTSRGSVRLRSADPYAKPRIVNNHLTTDEDRAAMVAGLRIALEIARQEPLAEISTGCIVGPDRDDDEGLIAFARRTGWGLYHPTSTCGIGRVVDPRLRVRGIDGLRVVDASVMPTVTRGNTNAPTLMIAERAADLIREDALSISGVATA